MATDGSRGFPKADDPVWDDPTLGRLAGALGLGSFLLLVAAFLWAHHWGPRADAIVAAWLLSTVSALVLARRALERRDAALRLAFFGQVLAAASLLALVGFGLASAAGADPSSYCGGG